jgi:uncharacterized protein (DUF885 family)
MRKAIAAGVVFLCATVALASTAFADVNSDFERQFGDAFFEAYWPLHPDDAITAGYYKGADKLLVPDAAARERQRQFLESWLAKLDRFKPESLNAAHRTDRTLLENRLRRELWELERLREWEWSPDTYNVGTPFALLIDGDYAPADQRFRTVLKRLEKVPAYYAAAKASVHNPTREHTQLAIEQNRGVIDLFGTDLTDKVAKSGLSGAERKLFETRLTNARAAIEDYVQYLESLDRELAANHKARTFRLGRVLYEQKFGFANPGGGTAEALYQRAQTERLAVLEKMGQLADELWPKVMGAAERPADRNARIGAVITKLSADHVAPAEYVGYVRNLLPQLEKWVDDHHLLTLDPTKPLVVRDTPAYERGVAIAGIESPGPYNPGARTYFNVLPLDTLPPDQAESFLREYNNWMSPIFIIHEAIPGHYVQLIYSNRSPSRIKAIFGNDATVEGWAVYAERMMLESGYGMNAPELWLVYWKWYLRSVTNTVLDYAVHVLGMSEQDVLEMLTQEAFQSEKEATGKWRRVQLSSVQLTSYYAGFAQIYAYREQLKQQQGARFDLRRFHEQFLSYGSAPVPTIIELMSSERSRPLAFLRDGAILPVH